MAAATGVHIGAISDPQRRGCLNLSLTGQGGQHQKDNNEQTPPTFLVTQSLVSLLTEKGLLCYSTDRAEHDTNGERVLFALSGDFTLMVIKYETQTEVTPLPLPSLFLLHISAPPFWAVTEPSDRGFIDSCFDMLVFIFGSCCC